MIDGATGTMVTLSAGLATYAGASGAGALLIRATRMSAPAELRAAAAPVLGLAALGLVVQLLGIGQVASRPTLSALWAVVAVLGIGTTVVWAKRTSWRLNFSSSALASSLVVLAALAMLLALIAALAPSTKIDETYYHMLVPRRLVEDGALRFYRAPIESAIEPQMLYQIAMAPLYALGLPDGANVVSWALSVTLLVFAWRTVSSVQRDPRVPAAVALVLACAPYIAVWHTTGGSHAFGDLAMMLAVMLALGPRPADAMAPQPGDAALASTLAACAAASKLSLWPLALVVTAFAAFRRAGGLPAKGRALGAAMLPWLIVMIPIATWTWVKSGSPFGPVLTDLFGSTVYAAGEPQSIFAAMRASNSWQRAELVSFVASYSPLFWIGAVAGLRSRPLDHAARRALVGCAVGQAILVIGWLPHEARFLGGLPFALFVIGGASFPASAIAQPAGRRWATAVLALTLPWLGAASYFTARMAPVVVGAETRVAFSDRFVALSRDFRALDGLLPHDARLLVTGESARIPSVYAPRPIYYDERDLPAGGPVYVMQVGASSPQDEPRLLRQVRMVYEDSAAIAQVYRTVGRPPDIAPLRVFEAEWVIPTPRPILSPLSQPISHP